MEDGESWQRLGATHRAGGEHPHGSGPSGGALAVVRLEKARLAQLFLVALWLLGWGGEQGLGDWLEGQKR